MDPLQAIGALIGVLGFAGTVAGAVKAYGMMQQKVADQAGDIADTGKRIDALEARVEKAESTAVQTTKLADAVEHMGEKFAAEIKRLGDIWSVQHEHTREQLDDIKGQLRREVK
jgi:hypothetical protein